MLKTFSISFTFYVLLGIMCALFICNSFPLSAVDNYIFRIVGTILLFILATYPLLIATSENFHIPTWVKVFLYIIFVILELVCFMFSFLIFNNGTFFKNKEMTPEEFNYIHDQVTSKLWFVGLLISIGNLIGLSIKQKYCLDDIHFLWIIPLSPLVLGLFIIFLWIKFVVFVFKIIFKVGPALAGDSTKLGTKYTLDNGTEITYLGGDNYADESGGKWKTDDGGSTFYKTDD